MCTCDDNYIATYDENDKVIKCEKCKNNQIISPLKTKCECPIGTILRDEKCICPGENT